MANKILSGDEERELILKPLVEALRKAVDALPEGGSFRMGMFEFKKTAEWSAGEDKPEEKKK